MSFRREVWDIGKRLLPEEQGVVDAIEPLDDSIAPGLPLGDEANFHSEVEAQADEEAEAPRVAIRPAEGEFVIQLERLRNAEALPGRHDGIIDICGTLTSHSFQGHRMRVGIDGVEALESGTPLEITGSHKVQLLHEVRRLRGHDRIGRAVRLIRRLNHQSLPSENPVDGPQGWQWLNARLPELPLNRQRALSRAYLV